MSSSRWRCPRGGTADDVVDCCRICPPSPRANILLSDDCDADFGVAYSLSDAKLSAVRMPPAKMSASRDVRMERSRFTESVHELSWLGRDTD